MQLAREKQKVNLTDSKRTETTLHAEGYAKQRKQK